MPREFRAPDLRSGQIELRHDDGVICIYATTEGLQRLVGFCQRLIENPKMSHIHLEDHQVLTGASLRGTIAVFERVGEKG